MLEIKVNTKGKWILVKKNSLKPIRIFDTLIEAKMYSDEHYPNEYEIITDEPKKKSKKGLIILSFIIFILLLIGIAYILYHFEMFSQK